MPKTRNMKKLVIIILLSYGLQSVSAQNNILIKHDTTLLTNSESEWVIKSLLKNDLKQVSNLGRELPAAMLEAIKKGLIKAYDFDDNKLIPAKQIYTWKMPVDSVMEYDEMGNPKRVLAVQNEVQASSIDQIRIYNDWYYDVATGKFSSKLKWIEPMIRISTFDGRFIGRRPFCRIYY